MAFSRLLEILLPGPFHNIGRSPACSQFAGHEPHVGIYMAEEMFISLAKIVKTGITMGCLKETMFGAFPATGEQDGTLLAERGQGIFFPLPE